MFPAWFENHDLTTFFQRSRRGPGRTGQAEDRSPKWWHDVLQSECAKNNRTVMPNSDRAMIERRDSPTRMKSPSIAGRRRRGWAAFEAASKPRLETIHIEYLPHALGVNTRAQGQSKIIDADPTPAPNEEQGGLPDWRPVDPGLPPLGRRSVSKSGRNHVDEAR